MYELSSQSLNLLTADLSLITVKTELFFRLTAERNVGMCISVSMPMAMESEQLALQLGEIH